MKSDIALARNIYKQFRTKFTNEIDLTHGFTSLLDLVWQISVNRILEKEKGRVVFWVNVDNGKNELLLAFESGGFKHTGLYFENYCHDTCLNIVEEMTEYFFRFDKKEQMEIMSKSMALS